MAVQIYHPFSNFSFGNGKCFLTGQPLSSTEEKIQVFPQWLMSANNLQDQPFKLLDESIATYKDLKIPCSATVNENFLEPLESEISEAFAKGYEGVKMLDEQRLFQWVAKLMYGVVFNELQSGIKMQHAQGEEFTVSQALTHKFSHLHLMLQSINLPIQFEDFKPYSVFLFKVDNKHQEFGYRDEINTQTFALRVKDFGLVMCLQDNGCNARYLREVYDKIKEEVLHPIQFEEFSARVFYSNYLFNRLPEYEVMPVGDDVFIEALPLRGFNSKPLFDEWTNKTYGQVLENFWKNWGFLLFEIIKDPHHTMSFLFNPDGSRIDSASIALPR